MKKKCKILLGILMLVAILLPIEVKADSFKLNVTANKSNVQPGETVELTFNLSDIDAGTLGINSLQGYIEYDTNIFEEITASSIQSLNNWSVTYNNEDTEENGKFLAVILQAGVTESQDIAKITFKVKNGVQYTNTTIRIHSIISNNGQSLINETDKQVTLEIGTKPQDPADNGNGSGNDQGTNDGSGSNNGQDVNSNIIIDTNTDNSGNANGDGSNAGNNGNGGKDNAITVQNENVSSGTLPQTGEMDYIYFIAAITLIVTAGIVYTKYKKVDK